MRLIFSAILAAALVFGGTLLFAGYMDDVSLPRQEGPGKTVPDRDSETRRSIWHCPDVQAILADEYSDVFDPPCEVCLAALDEMYAGNYTWEWTQASLTRLYGVTDGIASGHELQCEYMEPYGDMAVTLSLSSALDARVVVGSGTYGPWNPFYEGKEYRCRNDREACKFTAFVGAR